MAQPIAANSRRDADATREWRRLATLPARLLARLVAMQRRHRERMQLAEMDAAALKDIGLSRCDTLAELRKPRWRR